MDNYKTEGLDKLSHLFCHCIQYIPKSNQSVKKIWGKNELFEHTIEGRMKIPHRKKLQVLHEEFFRKTCYILLT